MNKVDQMDQIKQVLNELKESPLYEYRVENDYQPVIGEGSVDADIMFIGEAPGKREAESGRPFCGASGRMLEKLLESIELDRKDVYITNVVKDRPPKNRDPKSGEVKLYAPFLKQQIEIIQPKVVATLGRFAMNFMFDYFEVPFETKPQISDAHGQNYLVKSEISPIVVVPLYHPAYALYNPNNKSILLNDFQTLKSLIG